MHTQPMHTHAHTHTRVHTHTHNRCMYHSTVRMPASRYSKMTTLVVESQEMENNTLILGYTQCIIYCTFLNPLLHTCNLSSTFVLSLQLSTSLSAFLLFLVFPLIFFLVVVPSVVLILDGKLTTPYRIS